MENKNYIWRPVSEYTGGRVLATNGLDVLIGEINCEGDCESEEYGGTVLCGITGFIKIEEILPESKDKVEPKFHEGEWLCENEPNNYARFIQILEIVNVQGKERYRISRDIHNDEDIVECRFVEKYYHKFDIKDAEAGDVLRIRNLTFIFQEITNNNACHKDAVVAYCSYEDNDDGFGVCGPDCITDLEIITPATKEQRDLLFQKMKEAGYEWDSENRELIKIDHKELTDFQERLRGILIESNGKYDDNTVIRLSGQVLELVELKTAEWSEEDGKKIDFLVNLIRFQVKDSKYSFGYGDNVTYVTKDEAIDMLKSLRRKWRPTEDQIMCLQDAISNYQHRGYKAETLESLCKQLKQLLIMSSYTTGNKVCNHCKGSGKKFLIFKCPYCNGKGSIYGTFKDD